MKVIALLFVLLLTAAASQARSVGVKGASDYGPQTSFAGCEHGTVGGNCEAFNLTPIAVVSFNGLSYNVYQFVSGNGTSAGTLVDLIDIGSIGPNATFTLPSLFAPASTEVFSCNTGGSPTTGGNTFAFDSGGVAMAGPCTPGLTSAPAITQTGSSFTTGSHYNVYNLVLDVPVPDPTPEPSSMLLFGTGLLGLAPLRRKLFGR